MKNIVTLIAIMILTPILFLSCEEEEKGSAPVLGSVYNLSISPVTTSRYSRLLKDTLEVCFGDTVNRLELTLKNVYGNQIPFPEPPVFSLSRNDIELKNNNTIYPVRISYSGGNEKPVVLHVKSGKYESEPYYIFVIPKFAKTLDSLSALGEENRIISFAQTGRVLSIRTIIGLSVTGVMNTDNLTIRNLVLSGTLIDVTGKINGKITPTNVVSFVKGTETVDGVTFSWEMH